MFQTKEELILASGSLRRQAYLQEMGIEFKVLVADVDEAQLLAEDPCTYVCRVARLKARKVMAMRPQCWVIAADTTVSIDNTILGKPENLDDAVKILMRLSGREHQVITAFCLGMQSGKVFYEENVVTKVKFAPFSEGLARKYANTGEPLDKAGAYGIQGRGAFLVSEVFGSYSNVVGLPLCQLIVAMEKFHIIDPG